MNGGFPESPRFASITDAQRYIREIVVEKMIKHDMTARHGVRNILDLEKVFLYICLNDGSVVDVQKLSKLLSIHRTTINGFLDLMEKAHVIHRLKPYSGGANRSKSQNKIYLADPAIAGSMLMRGESAINDASTVEAALEAMIFKHLHGDVRPPASELAHWVDSRTRTTVDIVSSGKNLLVWFDFSFGSNGHDAELAGLRAFCKRYPLAIRAYLISQSVLDVVRLTSGAQALKIPAALACYWMAQSAT